MSDDERRKLDASYVRGEMPAAEFIGKRRAIDAAADVRDIPPALSDEQWRKGMITLRAGIDDHPSHATLVLGVKYASPHALAIVTEGHHIGVTDVGNLAALIAFTNAAMHDEDPRKFTREHVAALRARVEAWGDESIAGYEEPGGIGVAGDNPQLAEESRQIDLLSDLADVIESYLPPLTNRDTR